MSKYVLVRDKVPHLLEKWEKNPITYKSAKEQEYLHKGLYTVKLKEEFDKLLKSIGESNNEKTFEQMAEVLELMECISLNCLHTGFPRVLKIKAEKNEREGSYQNQMLVWDKHDDM